MAQANRMLGALLAGVVIIAGFWMLALGPKRDEAKKLDQQAQKLESQVAQAEQSAQFGRAARDGFGTDYQQLVVLGKAAPGDEDTGSFLVQLNRVAERAGVEFRSIELVATGTPPPVTAAPPLSGEPSTTEPPPEDGTAAPVSSTVPATESAAATLPIGATIGSAGLAILPYELQFRGDFFEIADFLASVDGLVRTENGSLDIDGRLVTVDGFSLSRDGRDGFPSLVATMAVTTYLAPASQGTLAGATGTGPAGTPVATTTPTAAP